MSMLGMSEVAIVNNGVCVWQLSHSKPGEPALHHCLHATTLRSRIISLLCSSRCGRQRRILHQLILDPALQRLHLKCGRVSDDREAFLVDLHSSRVAWVLKWRAQ